MSDRDPWKKDIHLERATQYGKVALWAPVIGILFNLMFGGTSSDGDPRTAVAVSFLALSLLAVGFLSAVVTTYYICRHRYYRKIGYVILPYLCVAAAVVSIPIIKRQIERTRETMNEKSARGVVEYPERELLTLADKSKCVNFDLGRGRLSAPTNLIPVGFDKAKLPGYLFVGDYFESGELICKVSIVEYKERIPQIRGGDKKYKQVARSFPAGSKGEFEWLSWGDTEVEGLRFELDPAKAMGFSLGVRYELPVSPGYLVIDFMGIDYEKVKPVVQQVLNLIEGPTYWKAGNLN